MLISSRLTFSPTSQSGRRRSGCLAISVTPSRQSMARMARSARRRIFGSDRVQDDERFRFVALGFAQHDSGSVRTRFARSAWPD
jgi:hypothetical protein